MGRIGKIKNNIALEMQGVIKKKLDSQFKSKNMNDLADCIQFFNYLVFLYIKAAELLSAPNAWAELDNIGQR